MLSHLRLGVILMRFCEDVLSIPFVFLGEFLLSFGLLSYNQNRVHEGLLLIKKQLSRGVTTIGTKFGVYNVTKSLRPSGGIEGVSEGVVVLFILEDGICCQISWLPS